MVSVLWLEVGGEASPGTSQALSWGDCSGLDKKSKDIGLDLLVSDLIGQCGMSQQLPRFSDLLAFLKTSHLPSYDESPLSDSYTSSKSQWQ